MDISIKVTKNLSVALVQRSIRPDSSEQPQIEQITARSINNKANRYSEAGYRARLHKKQQMLSRGKGDVMKVAGLDSVFHCRWMEAARFKLEKRHEVLFCQGQRSKTKCHSRDIWE